ncbi:bifunctional metallophosphatase/5'-nucleotidase [Arcanobacterium phocae]|uniref:bifunctional metallophosphatase/5'-nucleotidase n=1 Tax=Arcanobacterium phocae TaxID=131112 RepID=UPI001C0EB10B|nr:bifunctional UDP-sugar hydrolase/5'-nucleotidase [Arcanobacterium phocae]
MKNPMKRVAIGAFAAASLIMAPVTAWADEPAQPAEKPADAAAETKVETAQPAAEEPVAKDQEKVEKADSVVTLNLFNLTDIHGHIEPAEKYKKPGVYAESGLAAVKCYIDKVKGTNPNTQFTLLGDNIGASPFTSGSAMDNPTIEALNAMNVFASTIGNHEFDKGIPALKSRFAGTDGFIKIGFPYLGANVEGLSELGDYKIWESPSGVKVGFIGGIENDVATKLPAGTVDSLTFHEAAPAINKLADQLKDGDETNGEADIVVAMYDNDVKLSYPKMNKNVDIIMGGDTHVPYFGLDMVPAEDGHLITATASGSFTDNLSNVVVKYDKDAKKVVESRADKISATDVFACGQDPVVKAIVDKAAANAKAEKEKVVSEGTGNFYRGIHTDNPSKTPAPGSNRGVESTIGGLIADAMKDSFLTLDKKPIDIGIINAGGIRADLTPKEGVVTVGDVFAFMPFSNEVGYVTLTGEQFKTLLEQQWKTLSKDSSRPMLKLGLSKNVTYTFDPSRPMGDRITSIMLDGKPIDPAGHYTVGSVTFLLTGGDSFNILADPAVKATYKVIPDGLDRDWMQKYLKNNQAVQPRDYTSSIGVTITDVTTKGNNVSAKLSLRGLSFTVGSEAQTKDVTVKFGDQTFTAAVNNSIVDTKATTENAVVVADGAGYTEAFDIHANFKCPADAKSVHVPLVVMNDQGKVLVSADQMVGVDVNCGGVPASPKPVQHGQLAHTGASVGILGGLAVVAVLGGAVLLRRRKDDDAE